MGVSEANRLLWASLICVLWGLAEVVAEMTSEVVRITPPGLPGMTLLIIGILTGAVGQVLVRQAAKIESLERQLRRRDVHEQA